VEDGLNRVIEVRGAPGTRKKPLLKAVVTVDF
jgi:hypothetical protein